MIWKTDIRQPLKTGKESAGNIKDHFEYFL